MVVGQLKRFARRSKTLLVAYKIYNNWQMRRRFAAGRVETQHGSTHSRKSLAESLAYINEQFDDYLQYSGLTRDELKGKRILELGYGDNVGVALRFLAAGASQVVCFDKFFSARDDAHQLEIYRALRETLTDEARTRFDEAIDLSTGVSLRPDKLTCLNGLELEKVAARIGGRGSFDLIISRAVIEEVYDPASVFAAADELLAPGGLMLHKIDLSDYGMFRDNGMHPLTFLTIPERVYKLMATDSGIPNRKLAGYYQSLMDRMGYASKLFVTSLVGVGPLVPHRERARLNVDYTEESLALVRAIRPRLSRPFREMTDEELLTDGIFLVARKPGDNGR